MVGSVVVSFCQESGYEAVKISSHDEKDYLLKLVRDSTPDGSVPSVLLGKWISLTCTFDLYEISVEIKVFDIRSGSRDIHLLKHAN